MAKTVTHQDLKSYFGSEDHLEVSQQKSFSQIIFELLSEKEPSKDQLNIFELILNLSIDHGSDTPSAQKVIEEARKGETISEAVAEGIEQINDSHGGAGENLMKILYQLKSDNITAEQLVSQKLQAEERLPGFGHRIYKEEDPRAKLILDKLREVSLGTEYLDLAKNLERELNIQSGKKLPLNIDGAIAVVLCSFGWEPILGKAVFLIARTPGLVGQYLNTAK
ncbi:hypothetical protein HYS93_03730 [Candidatus Daviesbacteria bacterium]|nr:hypothetical protein [Candidatus Daviesbacteria bacterium]